MGNRIPYVEERTQTTDPQKADRKALRHWHCRPCEARKASRGPNHGEEQQREDAIRPTYMCEQTAGNSGAEGGEDEHHGDALGLLGRVVKALLEVGGTAEIPQRRSRGEHRNDAVALGEVGQTVGE